MSTSLRASRTAPGTLAALSTALLPLLLAAGAFAASPICVGDCDQDGEVLVDEIVRGTRIALGERELSSCPSLDASGDELVTVDELLQSVDAALNGCPRGDRLAFVVTTDFVTGSFGTISVAEPRSVSPADPARRIAPDAVARAFGGLVYVVNRSPVPNVQVLDPGNGFATRLTCSTGERSNPQDIAFVHSGLAYVTRYGSTRAWAVDPSVSDCADFLLGEIDLAAFADADGLPEMDQMAIVGDRLYISLQRLDQDNFFVPAGPGLLAVVDVASNEVVGSIELSGGNPFAHTRGLTVQGGSLVVSETGTFGVNDGGIERIDLERGVALGYFVTEEALGGDLTDFVMGGDGPGFAIVSRSDFSNALVAFDPAAGTLLRTLSEGGSLADIERNDRGELYVADTTPGRAGVRIFDTQTLEEITAEPIDLVLPPFDILFIP